MAALEPSMRLISKDILLSKVVLIGQAGRCCFGVLLSIVGIGRGCNGHDVSHGAELSIKMQARFLSCSPKQNKERKRFWKEKKSLIQEGMKARTKIAQNHKPRPFYTLGRPSGVTFFFVLRFPRTECADESLEDCGSFYSSSCGNPQVIGQLL